MSESVDERPDLCGPCFDGDHDLCLGLRCRCDETPRCLANSLLTLDRRLDDETGAA